MLAKIADVLKVGLGDLLDTDRDLAVPDRTPDEAELLRLFEQLKPSSRELVLRLARELGL